LLSILSLEYFSIIERLNRYTSYWRYYVHKDWCHELSIFLNEYHLSTWRCSNHFVKSFHDANELIKLVRRIMLSWFVKVNDDEKTLKNSKSKTWFEFSTCHKDLTALKKSSFEFVNHFDVISYRFFAIVELFDLEALSNVLMCTTRWLNSLIMHERDVFLNFKDETNKIIDEWRTRAVVFAIKIYQMIKLIERQAFDEKFYYYLKNEIVSFSRLTF
jgi:hypothetical protein